jgi:hypothetical protein
MISRPSSLRRLDPFEPELSESKRIDERVDHSNRIVLVDPVVQAFRKQRRLSAIAPSTKRFIQSPASPNRIISCEGFSHTQGQPENNQHCRNMTGQPSTAEMFPDTPAPPVSANSGSSLPTSL